MQLVQSFWSFLEFVCRVHSSVRDSSHSHSKPKDNIIKNNLLRISHARKPTPPNIRPIREMMKQILRLGQLLQITRAPDAALEERRGHKTGHGDCVNSSSSSQLYELDSESN